MDNNCSKVDNSNISECKEKGKEFLPNDNTSLNINDVNDSGLSNIYIKNDNTHYLNTSNENNNTSSSNSCNNSTPIKNSNNNICYNNNNTNCSSCEFKSTLPIDSYPNDESCKISLSSLSPPSTISPKTSSPPPPLSVSCLNVNCNSIYSYNSSLSSSSPVFTSSLFSPVSNPEISRSYNVSTGCLNLNHSSTLSSSFSNSSCTSSLSSTNGLYGFSDFSIPSINIKDPYMDLLTPGMDINRKTAALREVISMGVQSLNGIFLTKVWNKMKDLEEVKIIFDLIKEDKEIGKYDEMLKEIGRLRLAIDVFNSSNSNISSNSSSSSSSNSSSSSSSSSKSNTTNNNINNSTFYNNNFTYFNNNTKRKKKKKKARKNESEIGNENKRKREIESESESKIDKENDVEEKNDNVCTFNIYVLSLFHFFLQQLI